MSKKIKAVAAVYSKPMHVPDTNDLEKVMETAKQFEKMVNDLIIVVTKTINRFNKQVSENDQEGEGANVVG